VPGYEVFGEEERQAINELFELNGGILFAHGFDALRKGVYRVREFEAAFANKMGVPYAQAVSSCTAALRVALAALGIKRGDEIIIPSFTFVATAEAVIQSGADLVIVDIDNTLNMDPLKIDKTITTRTKAIIPVHMMGAPADMEKILSIADEHKLHVLEDAAQACGGTYKGKPLGTIGHLGAFSFDAGKVMITGEGGMIATSDKDLYINCRAYHDHGHEYSTTVSRGEEGAVGEGFNYRMTELQGAIGIVQLKKLDMIINKQRANKKKLMNLIKDIPFEFRRIIDDGELGDAIIFFLDSKQQADKFVKKMKEEALGTKNVPDAMCWHFSKYWSHIFKKYGWYRDSYQTQWKQSSDILERAVALPIMIKMTDGRIAEIGEKIIRIAKEIR
jgi:8-amino-3,8-dideoxy-alpha-D-manno-octulosonate transaminase